MELNSLIFLLMLVYCSQTVSSIEIITESSRLWPNPFDRLFNATKFIRKPESQEKPDLEFYHPDDLKLLHTVKSQKIIPPKQLTNDQQQPYPIAKLVEELFPGFKFTTSRPRKSTHPPAPTSKEKVNRPVRKSGSAPKKKRKHSKPFWGPPITTTSPRPRFYTRPTTRQNPLKNSQEDNIEDSEEHRPLDEDFLAVANPPTTKNSEAPVIKIKPSHPFWGPPFATSTTWPPYNTRTASSAIPRETEDDFPFHLSNVAINNNDISEHSTPFSPNVAELKQSYDQANSNERTLPEHFREPVHLKPGPPYHETTSKQQQQQQEHHDPLDQNIWHPLTQTVTEPTFIPIPPKSDLPQQQLLEPGVADNHEQHFPIYSGITPILDVSQLQSKETDSLASYPKKTYPHPAKPETHVIYHQPPATHNNYYHPPTGLTHVDFSPIFLAIVPIALFLGAAAAFALASAVTSSTAVATAQQQQQQQEESNSNNNNDNNSNNNNMNTILSLLAAFNEVKKHHDDSHKIVIVTDEPDLTKVAATDVPAVTIDPPPSPSPSPSLPPSLPPSPSPPPSPPPSPSPSLSLSGPFFVKVNLSTTPTPPGEYDHKKMMYYHHMNGVT
ncbi:pollen-specific leucine-rich repeat extensin-like protein 1 isoform X2 [Daphnia pulicaria]|uniref:pollen-specific leucine-rich repeat extensin-like protein 1 isoform X2 n=1 Tax=Daphnia pulicaria TaxID=35523 RepID=UPI001EEB2620|nr:pollen-specific leucine-rich repeat extensin-like protein 1 isoform X2 [Daphnia pulicaria]